MSSWKRRISAAATIALVAGVVSLSASISPASAGTAVNTNACQNSATGTFTDVAITTNGASAPNPATLGAGTITTTGTSYDAFFDAAVLVAGYNLGLLVVGPNPIPGTLEATINASNTAEGSLTTAPIALVGNTTITDPDGTPGTGDESATDLAISVPIPDSVWTPTGGDIEISDGGAVIIASVAGGLINVTFTCSVGTSTPAGCVLDALVDCTGFDPAAASAFDTVTVIAPPAPPVCSNGAMSVGLGQSAVLDLNTLCSDQNSDLDPTTYAISTPATAGNASVDATGLATYDSVTNPGGADSFGFTVNDVAGLGPSVEATVTVSVLANSCDATAAACSLTQIVTFTVNGAPMTLTQADQFIALSDITLNGQPQIASGTLNDVVVLNQRGSAAGWTVSAYSTDYGIAGLAPTADFDGPGPAPAVYACSADALVLSGGAIGAPDRNCITGNNMGYSNTASVIHDQIPGDVAAVTVGPASAADAATWLATLAGGSNVGGMAGYTGNPAIGGPQSEICSAALNVSGGTFACDSQLWLGVPASAGAGLYNGAIILTLT